jgi:hypothetical protein
MISFAGHTKRLSHALVAGFAAQPLQGLLVLIAPRCSDDYA